MNKTTIINITLLFFGIAYAVIGDTDSSNVYIAASLAVTALR